MFVRKLDRLKNLKQLARLEHLDNIPDCLNALVLLATNEIITEEEFTQILDRLEKKSAEQGRAAASRLSYTTLAGM